MRRLLLAAVLTATIFPGSAPAERTQVDPAAIRAALEACWEEMAPSDASLEVLAVPVLFHEGEEARLEVSLPEAMVRGGPRALPVSCRVGSRIVARGLANVVVRVRRPVWITTRELQRNELLDLATLRREEREFDREPVRLFAPVEGKRWRLARGVPAGLPLRGRHVRELPDVEAGSEITLVSRNGTASVAVVARVRRSGNVGDTVLVHNPVTGALVSAVLVSETTAVLEKAAPRRRSRTPSERSETR